MLLGPLFGVDKSNNKIHVQLKEQLNQKFSLDDEFDNLFISKKTDGQQKGQLIDEICTFYEGMERNPVYDRIIGIGFRGIINLSADLFLYEADKANVYDYSYFSKKGNVISDEEDTKTGLSKKPILYNVFGDIRDLNSLITDYDSLYDFLINIMRAEKEFPLQLRDILGKASAFLFLGFDLSKWYIPLIVRKLNQFILNARHKTSVVAFASLDDTPLLFAQNNGGGPLMEGLNKYPLSFGAFNGMPSIEVIGALAAMPKAAPILQIQRREPTAADKAFFSRWVTGLFDYGATEGLGLFFREYKDLAYLGEYRVDFETLRMRYNETLNLKYSQLVTTDEYDVKMTNLVQSVLTYIHKIV